MANEQNLIPITSDTAAELGAKGGTNKKGSKHISTWIQHALEEEVEVEDVEQGKHKEIPIKAIVAVAIKKAKDGDNKWADWLGKYGYGTKTTLANDPDNPITPTMDASVAADFAQYMKQRTSEQ